MTTNTSPQPAVAKYRQLANQLREEILRGELSVGDPLPTYSALQARFGCAQNTLEKALAVLVQEGLIFRKPSSGVYVAPRKQAPTQTGFIGYVDDRWQRSANQLYYTRLLASLCNAAEEAGKQIVLIQSFNSFRQWEQLEAVVFCAAGHHFSFSSKDFLPYIPADMPMANLLFPLPGMPAAYADDTDGTRQSIEHLIGLGHRRIGYLTQALLPLMARHPSLQNRFRAYRETLLGYGLGAPPEWVFSPTILHEPDYGHYGYEGMKLWLDNGWEESGCTALLCQNDLCALGAINALQEAGLRVPEDVSVVGYDGSESCAVVPYRLTTVKVPLEAIGAGGLKLVLERNSSPSSAARDLILPVQLVIGETTAPVAQSGIARNGAALAVPSTK
jgi:LacI family transcriptional regulator